MAEKLAVRLETACEDPEFKEKYIRCRAEQVAREWSADHQPQGQYDPQAVFPLNGMAKFDFTSTASVCLQLQEWAIVLATLEHAIKLKSPLSPDLVLPELRNQLNTELHELGIPKEYFADNCAQHMAWLQGWQWDQYPSQN